MFLSKRCSGNLSLTIMSWATAEKRTWRQEVIEETVELVRITVQWKGTFSVNISFWVCLENFAALQKKAEASLKKTWTQIHNRVLSDFWQSFPNGDIHNKELTNINEEMIHKPNIWKPDNNSKICEVILKPLFGNHIIYFPIQHFSHGVSKRKTVWK